MKLFYADHFVLPLPPDHRFPMAKYALLRQRVAAELAPPHELCEAEPATDAELLRVHQSGYLHRLVAGELTVAEVRVLGFPWSPGLVERARRSVGGTLGASRAALEDGIGANLAGGTHHAYPDHGQGYCVFNDVAVAARALQSEGMARRILIVDLDVHQGNGTAAMFAADPDVFTLSIHGAKNFPFHKEISDLDIALADGAGDDEYLAVLEPGLEEALGRSQPDFVFYLAGADPYFDDRLGRLALTKTGLADRDRLVFERFRAAGLPVTVVMAGGYARKVQDTADIHFQTVRLATSYQPANVASFTANPGGRNSRAWSPLSGS